jgi:hypothetical protein
MYASEEEAAVRFSNLDGYVTSGHDPWTFYVQMDADDTDTACHLVQLQVEEIEDDEGRSRSRTNPSTRRPKQFRSGLTALPIHDGHLGVRR